MNGLYLLVLDQKLQPLPTLAQLSKRDFMKANPDNRWRKMPPGSAESLPPSNAKPYTPSSPALRARGSGRGYPGGQGGRGLPQGRADWLRGGVGHMASPAVSGSRCPVVRLLAWVRLDGKAAGMVAFNRIGIVVAAAASG